LRVLRAVPLEKLEWRHAAGVFSCGDLARHIAATERYTFAENVLGRPSRYHGCGPELASGHENVVAFMERMHRETIEMLKDLKPEDLNRNRARVVRVMVKKKVNRHFGSYSAGSSSAAARRIMAVRLHAV